MKRHLRLLYCSAEPGANFRDVRCDDIDARQHLLLYAWTPPDESRVERRGYSEADVEKILGGNIPRVMGDRPDEGPVVRPKSTEDPFSDPARLCDSRDCQQVMTRLSLLLAVILPLTFQSTTSSAIRLGPTGDRLTADDLEQIRRLDFGGRAVWVLVGQPRGFEPSNSWYVNAYLDPDHVRADIRRGRIAVLKAEMTSPDAYGWSENMGAGVHVRLRAGSGIDGQV